MKRLAVLGLVLLGAMQFARAQNDPVQIDSQFTVKGADGKDLTSYQSALLFYKAEKYDMARSMIDQAEKEKPGDLATEVLKARILTEQKDYAEGEKLLRSLLTPAGPLDVQLALGDLLLRKHSFERATKYYDLALQAKPKDPDIILKMVYAKVGASQLVDAGKYASELSPMDPKNPYDDHASYYFAQAALAQSSGNTQGADNDIQTARTIYGITVANRYLRTYLQVFATAEKNTDATPDPLVKPVPSGKQ